MNELSVQAAMSIIDLDPAEAGEEAREVVASGVVVAEAKQPAAANVSLLSVSSPPAVAEQPATISVSPPSVGNSPTAVGQPAAASVSPPSIGSQSPARAMASVCSDTLCWK